MEITDGKEVANFESLLYGHKVFRS